ncbi:DNA replication protein DnaC [Bradyrhizobium elkanii]
MLNHPTHERLIELGLTGMAKAFEEQRRSPDLEALPFEDRIGLLVDREAAERDTRRLTTRLKIAALRQTACVEDVDLRTPRGIDRAVFAKLVEVPRGEQDGSGASTMMRGLRRARDAGRA